MMKFKVGDKVKIIPEKWEEGWGNPNDPTMKFRALDYVAEIFAIYPDICTIRFPEYTEEYVVNNWMTQSWSLHYYSIKLAEPRKPLTFGEALKIIEEKERENA